MAALRYANRTFIMLSKALGTDIYHLWACKVLFLGVPHLLLS